MTQMFFHLVTFTLPSSQVAGRSCDKMCFRMERLQIYVQRSRGARQQGKGESISFSLNFSLIFPKYQLNTFIIPLS